MARCTLQHVFGAVLTNRAGLMSVLQIVQGFNADPAVHGILVQLPLPKHINEQRILDAVSFEKDVDGFHPQNIGCLAMRSRDPRFVCCTPKVNIPMLAPVPFDSLYCVRCFYMAVIHACHRLSERPSCLMNNKWKLDRDTVPL